MGSVRPWGQRRDGARCPWSPASSPRLPARRAEVHERGVPPDSPQSKPAPGWHGQPQGGWGWRCKQIPPWLCFPRADNHLLAFLVLLSPLFQYEFYYTSEMAVSKREFPTRAHKNLAGLGAVTQNRMQYHLSPGATSIQASPAHVSPTSPCSN